MPCAASNVCQTESAERCVRPLAPECSAGDRDAHFILFWRHIRKKTSSRKISKKSLACGPPTASALLKELEQRGLIRKEPVPYDARRKKIVATEEALQYKDCVLSGLEKLEQKLTAGIPDEEMQVFFTVTDKMLKNLAQ